MCIRDRLWSAHVRDRGAGDGRHPVLHQRWSRARGPVRPRASLWERRGGAGAVRMSLGTTNRRILVVDDNRDIHEDFRKLLGTRPSGGLQELEDQLFGATDSPAPRLVY